MSIENRIPTSKIVKFIFNTLTKYWNNLHVIDLFSSCFFLCCQTAESSDKTYTYVYVEMKNLYSCY